MNDIREGINLKVYLSENSCFICLQVVSLTNEEHLNSLNFLLNYLKIREKVKPVVCDKCRDHLMKFEKLSKILEKVRLEMDYLLEAIQFTILNSNKAIRAEPVASFRDSVGRKCGEQIKSAKAQLILQKLDISKLVKTEKQNPSGSDYFDDFHPNWEDDYSRASSDGIDVVPASPVVKQIKIIKSELNSTGAFPDNHTTPTSAKPTCPTCFKICSSKSALKLHFDAVHLRLKPFKCSKCLKGFGRNTHLRKHIKAVHLQIRPFKCDECERSFAEAKNLSNHKAKMHNPKPIPHSKPFSCDICGKGFDTIKTLDRHKQCVHPTRVFPCDVCKNIYKSRGKLKRHVSSVHNKQRHYCQVPDCDKSFSQEWGLNRHYKAEHPNFKLPKPDSDLKKFTLINDNGINVVECNLCRAHYKSVKTFKRHFNKVHTSGKIKSKFITDKHEAQILLEKDNEGKPTIVKVESDVILGV